MYKFIGKSNERILCKLRLYSIVHVAMETTKTSSFTCHSKSFISIFFTYQASACELQPFSCHDLASDIHSQTAKTLFSHLKSYLKFIASKGYNTFLFICLWVLPTAIKKKENKIGNMAHFKMIMILIMITMMIIIIVDLISSSIAIEVFVNRN